MLGILETAAFLLFLVIIGAVWPPATHQRDGETLDEYLERERAMRAFWRR